MKKLAHLFILVVVITFLGGCNLFHHSHSWIKTYDYTGRDSLGNAVAHGWFTLNMRDSSNITGDWSIHKLNDSTLIGPQNGTGHLVGSINPSGEIWIGLNPDVKDNNVFLHGQYHSDKFSGKWLYSSFIGLTNGGTFVAVKK